MGSSVASHRMTVCKDCIQCGEVNVVNSQSHLCCFCDKKGWAMAERFHIKGINTNKLQKVVMGDDYDENVINHAIELADRLEVKLSLIALRKGRCTFESRMLPQDFVCRLTSRENTRHMMIN